MKENNNTFLPVDSLLDDFSWYMNRHRESFTKEAFARRMEYGHIILKNYYDHYINDWNKIVVVEQNLKNILVQGIPLKGKLDKLEFNGNDVNVVDYKTGNVERRETKEKLLPPNEKNPDGGHYWRQAVFYKILIDHYNLKDWRVVSSEFDFIEPDKKKAYITKHIEITQEDVQIVLDQIKNTWQRIQHHDFYTGCGEEDCYWCNFTKEHQLYAVLEEEIE
jgi:DNA helicase-2/ATP-dependent DNA helicase PcrA